MRTQAIRRAAFQLRDLVVLIVIVSMLLFLLLPAVQRPRISSNGMDCKSKLRQCVLAALNCHEQMEFIPSNPAAYPNSNEPQFYATTQLWLLPYMDAATVFTPISERGLSSPATTTPLKIFQCKSDPTVASSTSPCCYVTNGNIFDPSRTTPKSVQNSLFNKNVIVTKIKDGQSNTIMFTEKLAYCSSWPQTAYPATAPVNRYPHQQYPSTLYTSVSFPAHSERWAWKPKPSAPTGWNPSYIASPPADVPGASGVQSAYPNGSGFQTGPTRADTADCVRPQSGHVSGINVGVCDGSVKTVTTAVDPRVWYAYSTPNGDEDPDPHWPQ